MNKKMLREILATHADQLLTGKANNKDYLDLLPESDEELVRLLAVAEQVQSTLQPLTPTNREALKRELLTTAQLRQAEGYTPPNPWRDLFFFLMALGFIVSLAVVLAAMRRRSQTTNYQLRKHSTKVRSGMPVPPLVR